MIEKENELDPKNDINMFLKKLFFAGLAVSGINFKKGIKEPKNGWCSDCVHRYDCEKNMFNGICIMNIETRECPTAYKREVKKC